MIEVLRTVYKEKILRTDRKILHIDRDTLHRGKMITLSTYFLLKTLSQKKMKRYLQNAETETKRTINIELYIQ